jgi:hypothetical protein
MNRRYFNNSLKTLQTKFPDKFYLETLVSWLQLEPIENWRTWQNNQGYCLTIPEDLLLGEYDKSLPITDPLVFMDFDLLYEFSIKSTLYKNNLLFLLGKDQVLRSVNLDNHKKPFIIKSEFSIVEDAVISLLNQTSFGSFKYLE